MKIPFQLRKLSRTHVASALLLPTHDAAELLALCVRIGSDPLPRVYAVADGFLLKLRTPSDAAFPNAVRLRGLSENLLLPVDADLVPTLLEDESAALVRNRGLIFLPGDQVLAFTPNQPISLTELISAGPVSRRAWQALPEPRFLAPSLRSINLELPEQSEDVLLAPGNEDVGAEPPKPREAGPGAKALSKVQAGLGRSLMGLGQMIGLGALTRLGAQMLQGAIDRAPGMLEKLLGKHEAALHWLLQKFQSGDIEEALRRAIPFDDEGVRGGKPASGTALPFHNLLYSLASLLGGSGRGGGTVVYGRDEILRRLMEEYRKAAEEAARRGDFRRAAFIYAKLLRDYRAAANMLMRGGLYHDAGVLFLQRVGDPLAAAGAFAQAGEFDRALHIYREKREHLLAAELLRKLGDEEAAVAEYRLAAEKLVADGGDYLAAGDLMLNKASVREAALGYFARGWNFRPSDNAVSCALRLCHLHAEDSDRTPLFHILDEADEHFRVEGGDLRAGTFYNEVARLGDRAGLEPIRDDLRDRALMGLGGTARRRAETPWKPVSLVSDLFGQSGFWSAAQVSDAQFAWRAVLKKRGVAASTTEAATHVIRVGHGTVTAVCTAAATGEVFLGFDDGKVCSFRPRSGEVTRIPQSAGVYVPPVSSLASDPTGEMLAVLRGQNASPRILMMYSPRVDRVYFADGQLAFPPGDLWLLSTIVREPIALVGLWDGQRVRLLQGVHLAPAGSLSPVEENGQPTSGVFLPPPYGGAVGVYLFEGQDLWYWPVQGEEIAPLSLGWAPSVPAGNPLEVLPPAVLRVNEDHLEFAGLTRGGSVFWTELSQEQGRLRARHGLSYVGNAEMLAATLVRPGLVAAVSRTGIDWLRCGQNALTLRTRTAVPLPSAVACFPSAPTNELLVVCQDGLLVRVPVPV